MEGNLWSSRPWLAPKLLVCLGRGIDGGLVLMNLEVLDGRDDDISSKSRHNRSWRWYLRSNAPGHVMEVPLAWLKCPCLPFPILKNMCDSLALGAVWHGKHFIDLLDAHVDKVDARTKLSPCSGRVTLAYSDPILGLEADQAERFCKGSALVGCFFLVGPRQPHCSEFVILFPRLFSSRFNINVFGPLGTPFMIFIRADSGMRKKTVNSLAERASTFLHTSSKKALDQTSMMNASSDSSTSWWCFGQSTPQLWPSQLHGRCQLQQGGLELGHTESKASPTGLARLEVWWLECQPCLPHSLCQPSFVSLVSRPAAWHGP